MLEVEDKDARLSEAAVAAPDRHGSTAGEHAMRRIKDHAR